MHKVLDPNARLVEIGEEQERQRLLDELCHNYKFRQEYDPKLPITRHREEILSRIATYAFTIIQVRRDDDTFCCHLHLYYSCDCVQRIGQHRLWQDHPGASVHTGLAHGRAQVLQHRGHSAASHSRVQCGASRLLRAQLDARRSVRISDWPRQVVCLRGHAHHLCHHRRLAPETHR